MHRSMFKGSLPPIISSPTPGSNSDLREYTDSDYYKVEWDQYFEKSRDFSISPNDIFRIYESNVDVREDYLFVFLHGGGYTSLSWSLVSDYLRKHNAEKKFRIMAYDCRGHGQTKTSDDSDLSIERLVKDCSELINSYNAEISGEGGDLLKVIVVGHSLGGAVAVKSANLINNLLAAVAVDIVEGTAIGALSSMSSIIDKRPRSFKDEKDAIKWSLSSFTIKNIDSARVSIPSQIKYNDSDKKYHWITDLSRTEPFWKDWFTGLSKEFLSSKGLKLLILAGTDRLDKELTIAQMQGKFQLIVLPKCGHVIQEDNPVSFSETLLEFISRFK